MTITRDWITVTEHAKSRGVSRQAIHRQIAKGRFQLPYVQPEGPNGTVLIYNPNGATDLIVNGKTEARRQESFDETACNRADNR